MNRARGAALVAFAAMVLTGCATPQPAPAPAAARQLTIYATQSGKPAYDADDFGGNPFASAFVQVMREPAQDMASTGESLAERTLFLSGGQQRPDLSAASAGPGLRPSGKGRAVALVVVFADYGDREGLASLPGAAFDAARVRGALARAGYEVQISIAPSREVFDARLEAFRAEARGADEALLYTTGHGFEVGGAAWLLPPEFDPEDLATPLEARAIRVAALHQGLAAKQRTIIIYAGCRDNPLGLE